MDDSFLSELLLKDVQIDTTKYMDFVNKVRIKCNQIFILDENKLDKTNRLNRSGKSKNTSKNSSSNPTSYRSADN